MTTRSVLGAILAACFIALGGPPACAASDAVDGSSDDSGDDAGADIGLDVRDSGEHLEAGTCSASKICVAGAAIDGRISFTSIWGSGPHDVWAVGTRGSIFHYAAAGWEQADLAASDASSPFTLQGVWLDRSDSVWIVDGNRIRHAAGWKGRQGTEWRLFGALEPELYEFIPTDIRGAGDVLWVARGGRSRGFGPVLRRLEVGPDGVPGVVQELELEPGGAGLSALSVRGADEVWAIGYENVVRVGPSTEDGGALRLEEHDSRTTRLLHGVWAGEDAVWLVGEGGTIRRMSLTAADSGIFEIVTSPVLSDLYAVFGFGTNDLWVVGDAAVVLHWDGHEWSLLSTPFDDVADKPRLMTVWGSSPHDVWIAGDATLLHFEDEP
jgi:hypothetical protein